MTSHKSYYFECLPLTVGVQGGVHEFQHLNQNPKTTRPEARGFGGSSWFELRTWFLNGYSDLRRDGSVRSVLLWLIENHTKIAIDDPI